MAKEKRYVEIEIEVDVYDGEDGGMTDHAWDEYLKLRDQIFVMGRCLLDAKVLHVSSNPACTSRRELQ
jgi:hypothetical protein